MLFGNMIKAEKPYNKMIFFTKKGSLIEFFHPVEKELAEDSINLPKVAATSYPKKIAIHTFDITPFIISEKEVEEPELKAVSALP
jgi:hypothetical protein